MPKPLRSALAGFLSAFMALVSNPIAAQNGDAPPAPFEADNEFRFDFVGTRFATRVYWRIDEKGQGEVSAQIPLGWAVENRDTDIGEYRFSQGVHRIDIGRHGYGILKAALQDFVSGNAGTKLIDEKDLNCDLPCLGGRVLSWRQDGRGGNLILPGGCDSAERSALAERMDSSWGIIARMLMRQGHLAVSESLQDLSLVVRKPLTLSLTHSNVWTGNRIDWEVRPDGKGWFKTSQEIIRQNPGPNLTPTNYIAAGKHKFEIGESGYLAIRRELDAYILGPAGKTQCIGGISDQPIARLRWSEKGTATEGLNIDTACTDYHERVEWTISFLGAKVGMPTVNVQATPVKPWVN
jgi:hypothetical protein